MGLVEVRPHWHRALPMPCSGWEENAPYDRIMVTAGANKLPDKLIEQLAPNGKMIIPVGPRLIQDLMLITKDAGGKVHKEVIVKVRFVELVDDV